MAKKIILFDGAKAIPINPDYDEPGVWEYFSNAPADEQRQLYARVSAAFQAVNKSARAVANMPFVLLKGKEEFDTSSEWQNKIGFMPNPKDLLRRLRQSLIMTNKGYWRMGRNVAGKPKQLHYVLPRSINIITHPVTGELMGFERTVNGIIAERYDANDNALLRWWWLDEDTELLPTEDTEFKAFCAAAGIIRYSDFFTKNYYMRGGIKPTLIAMKGLIPGDDKKTMERGWAAWVRGAGRGLMDWVSAKIYNAEALTIEPFGDGLGDLKETPVYQQAIEQIAIGLDMPLSLLRSNSANYATAQIEYIQWFRNSVIPWCEFIQEEMNSQLWNPLGLRWEFRPEITDPEQEDEVSRSSALIQFGDAFEKYPTYDLLIASAVGVFGYELPDDFLVAAKKYYSEKETRAEEVSAQMQGEQPPEEKPVDEPTDEQNEEQPPAKWIPSLDEFDELRIWREVAERKFRKSERLDFAYEPHHGGLPAEVEAAVKARLVAAQSEAEVKAAFTVIETAAPQYKSSDTAILELAASFNRMAEALNNTKQLPEST